MLNYSRYSHHARRALTHAGTLVKRYYHPSVDTGHLLVGVMLTTGSIGHTVLDGLNVEVDSAWLYLETLVKPVENPPDPPVNEASLEETLALAADEANWLGNHYIGTEHLLLGMTRTNAGNASALLKMMNITPDQVRYRVRCALKDGLTESGLEQARRNAKLSELSRRVINAAEQMAVLLDHETLGLGHMLMILAREQRSVSSVLLQDLDKAELQQALEDADAIALMSIETVLASAVDYARKLGSHYTGTEHLLLSLAHDLHGALLLQRFGLDATALHRVIEETLRKKS